MTFRRALLAALSTALLLGLAWGCSAVDDSSPSSGSIGGGTGIGEAGVDGQVVEPDGPSSDDGGGAQLNPLCGKAPACVPDDFQACGEYVPPSPAPGPVADAGASGEGGEGGEGGVAGLPVSVAAAGEAGAGGQSGAGGSAGEAGAGGAAGAPATPAPRFGCQVQRTEPNARSVVSQCSVVGRGAANAPCLTAADCQAGFGCVGDQSAGLCQKYCCQDTDGCETGTYCAERPLRDATINALDKGATDTASTLMIPVCVAAENCDLSAPYPCTAGKQCACKSGTACLVVRSDGTTTCAVPGTGKVGDACPCAWGHVCSAASNQCLELCYTRGSATCGNGKCQSATELPDGWGVCVGGTPNGG